MINEKMLQAFNQQINEELYSSYIYLSMSADFAAKGYGGFATWMRMQAQEENVHAMKMFDFVNERGGKVVLEAIKKPDSEWETPLQAFETTLAHEQYISDCINKLVDLAIEQKDHASNAFLQWFVTEQVEEEASASEILDKLKMVGGHSNALYMIDKELARRGTAGNEH